MQQLRGDIGFLMHHGLEHAMRETSRVLLVGESSDIDELRDFTNEDDSNVDSSASESATE